MVSFTLMSESRVLDGTAIMSDDVRNALGAYSSAEDLADIVGGSLGGDAANREVALDVVENTEVLTRLLKRHSIYKTSWVPLIVANAVVSADDALLDDGGHFTACEYLRSLRRKIVIVHFEGPEPIDCPRVSFSATDTLSKDGGGKAFRRGLVGVTASAGRCMPDDS